MEVNVWYWTPLTSLYHSAYPLIMRVLVVMNQLLESVELSGALYYMCCNTGSRAHGRVILTPVNMDSGLPGVVRLVLEGLGSVSALLFFVKGKGLLFLLFYFFYCGADFEEF